MILGPVAAVRAAVFGGGGIVCKFATSEHHPDFPPTEIDMEEVRFTSRVLVLLLMAAAAGAVAAFTPAPPKVLRAERVELVTPQGFRQAQLSTDSLGLTVTLFDRNGHEAATFRLNQEPRLTVLDGTRREVVGLGAPRPQHLTN